MRALIRSLIRMGAGRGPGGTRVTGGARGARGRLGGRRALIRSLIRMGTRKSPSVRPRSSCGMRSMRADADTGPMLPDEPDGGGQPPGRGGGAAEGLAVRLGGG